jgi:hypothetical protein
MSAVISLFHFKPTEQFIAHISIKGWRYDARVAQAIRKSLLMLYIVLDLATTICGVFSHCHFLRKELDERARLGQWKQNYRRHDISHTEYLPTACCVYKFVFFLRCMNLHDSCVICQVQSHDSHSVAANAHSPSVEVLLHRHFSGFYCPPPLPPLVPCCRETRVCYPWYYKFSSSCGARW